MNYGGKLSHAGAALLGLTLAAATTTALAQTAGEPQRPMDATSPAPPPADPGSTVVAGQAPPAQVQALASGDNKTVTNGPVPDTPANRAKYGRPMSHLASLPRFTLGGTALGTPFR
jgi:hypothetical protein